MEFVSYKTKSQNVSNLLQQVKCSDELLSCKDIELENDFQCICNNSCANIPVVIELIVKLSQNENRKIIEDNVRSISISLWNDIYNKNNYIKEIFVNNFDKIIESAGFITYRDLEKFINDQDTKMLLYSNINHIVKKLCTYDRASIISDFSKSNEGCEAIKSNIELFFQKGEYDISTTYSKILVELSRVRGLNKQTILEACCNYLTEMIARETAVDNETNALLNWIYDAMEECKMDEMTQNDVQKKIDDAILTNFENILDKTNYDRETIKVLKLFSCTHGKFSNNKSMFIENSSKLVHMTKIYDLNYEKEGKEEEQCGDNANIENQKQDNTQSEEIQNIDYDEMDNLFGEEQSVINEYAALLKESESSDRAEDIIEALIKSHINETDKIVDRIVNKDDTKTWDGSFMNADNYNSDNESTKVYKVSELAKITIDYGKGDVVEQATVNTELSEEKYSFSRNVKEENALIVNNDSSLGVKKVIKVVKGFFRKVKMVLSKYKSERIGE